MKTFTIIFTILFFASIYSGCVSDNKKAKDVVPPLPPVVKGDFKGEGKQAVVQLIGPQLNKQGTDCLGGCTSYIRFSDTTIKPIRIDSCIGGMTENLGDLNGDGKDEIGVLREWFKGCWKNYYVYSYINNNWELAVPPIPTHCNQWTVHIKPIEKDSLNQGYVIVHYSESENGVIVNKSKIVAIK